MADTETKVLVCTCEGTMRVDVGRITAGLGPEMKVTAATQLCQRELSRFKSEARGDRTIVCCTHQVPLFREVAEDEGLNADIGFVNVRETAGWSSEGDNAGPKMAALIAGAMEPDPVPPGVVVQSEGVALIYGAGQAAIDAAQRLKDRLDLTVLLSGAGDVIPPARAEFPVRKGRIKSVKGSLGGFEIAVDGCAEPAPSSRGKLRFGNARDGLVSRADILIDLAGGAPLVTAPELREGYLRADPADPLGVERLLFRAADLVGTFDKPRYVTMRPELCAHARSRITGCTRCLDLCPAGAIVPSGDHVVIDPGICGGCGQCAAACPTGAASYELPRADLLLRRLRRMLMAYRTAGGTDAVLLIHDAAQGEELIDAAAHLGDGLPARVIPVAVNEVTQVGLEALAAAFAYGAAGVALLMRAKPRHDVSGLRRTVATSNALLEALGYGPGLVRTIETDDPDALIATLRGLPTGCATPRPSQFLALGAKRDVLKLAVRELHRAGPSPVDTVALPAGAPFGRVVVRTDGCTLCLSCVSACPTGALGDDKERPLLRFDESLCVQCGLCRATCPEKVITLDPRLHFPAFGAGHVTLKEEEPFCCTRCSKPFGTRSAIERVIAKLEGSHWMFGGEQGRARLEMLKMCDDCRIIAATEASLDPYGAPPRPAPKTSDDYLREREERERRMKERIEKGEV